MEELIQNNLASLASFRPESALGLGAVALFLLDVLWARAPARRALLTAAAVAVVVVAGLLLAWQPGGAHSLFNGFLATDAFATFFKWLFLAAALLTVLIVAQGDDYPDARVGEMYALLLAVVLGMFLMASATHLLTIYMSIELVSMVSYVLAGLRRTDRKASEAALKYVLFGAVASGVMLFGMSWLYGLLGTADLREFGFRLAALSAEGRASAWPVRLALVVSLVFVSSGVGYKIASVPWHMWCPDVYEGAPTPFTAFLSVGPKAAGFAVALRLFLGALSTPIDAAGLGAALQGIPWPALLGLLSAVTMTLGNLSALGQNNLKRLLAYSSIAHAGYALMGLSAVSSVGLQGVLVYLAVYLVMNLGAFLVVIAVAEGTGLGDHRRLPGPGAPPALHRHRLRHLPHLAHRPAAHGRLHRQVVPLLRGGGAGHGRRTASGTACWRWWARSTRRSRSPTTRGSCAPCSSTRRRGAAPSPRAPATS